MKWRLRPTDLVTGVAMLVILAGGGLLLTNAPSSDTGATSGTLSPTDPPSSTPTEAVPTPDDETEGDDRGPKGDRGGEPEIEEVPESGTGMEIVMPGDAAEAPEFTSSLDLNISSFNLLGTSHTVPGGTHSGRGYAPGPTRARWAASLVRDQGLDIVGWQELEADQARTVLASLPGYQMYPGPSGRRHASANSIMWRTDDWTAVQTSTIGIPYFGGKAVQMPYVRLRHRATGTDLWVGNFHNPASGGRRGNNAGARAEATRRQIRLANYLREKSGLPVIFTGDFNEKGVYFCRLVGATELENAFGGQAGGGGCSPPAGLGIDHIYGTPELAWLDSASVRRGIDGRVSDHPMILARARLTVIDQEAVDEARRGLERLEESG